ncbi:MAG: hypothetical protein ACR2FN_08335 [Chitinophagaceae bacterium]
MEQTEEQKNQMIKDEMADATGANQKTEMNTLSHIMEKLRLKKLDHEFRLTPEGFSAGKGKCYQPEDLKIIKTYRFEGESDPADSSILYLIEANDGLIGYSIDAYGVYSDHQHEEGYDNFIRKIPVEGRDDQLIFDV